MAQSRIEKGILEESNIEDDKPNIPRKPPGLGEQNKCVIPTGGLARSLVRGLIVWGV